MPIRPFNHITPKLAERIYVDETAVLIGDVTVGADSSFWPTAVVRGDVNTITIGKRCNIQDASVLHVAHQGEFNATGQSLILGDDITVGHGVILHACQVEDSCLIGMGSVIMDAAIIESEIILGAGSLVPPGKILTSGYLYLGNPVKQIRPLTVKEKAFITYSAKHYVGLKDQYLVQEAD